MFKELNQLMTSDHEAFEYLNRMAELNSPNGDIYEGKSAGEILTEIDNQRSYQHPLQTYQCPVCGNKSGVSKYNQDTKQNWWRSCECLVHKQNLTNVKSSGLGELLNHTVRDFKVTEEYQKKMKELAVQYIQSQSSHWLMYLGQSGCGKTMLCSAICNRRLREGKEVKYLLWNEFMETWNSMSGFDKERETYFSTFATAEVLYIDDLFKGVITEHRKDVAFRLVNYRYNRNLVTIISSELLFGDLANLDEAIAGRIFQKTKYQTENGEEKMYIFEVDKDVKKNYRLKF